MAEPIFTAGLSALSNLVTIFDKVNQQKDAEFFDYIEDTHRELKLIHSNYLQVFTEVQTLIENGEELESIFNTVRSSRLLKEADRRSIINKVDKLLELNKRQQYADFLICIRKYFYGMNIRGGFNTPSNMLQHELKLWIEETKEVSFMRYAREGAAEEALLIMIQNFLSWLRNEWDVIDNEYLKLKYVA
ncbi:hypothetical protein [Vibrio parahaemolyticus]|uniref:hypothetical protein n=1 Tax=Vibrio parahaemolyticus TaxID=670 RepID=UPI00111C9569|nr:hypothetical protein [Vibrio parahaemolyticus]TOI27796.1 hypothetical protein CGI64_12120 [Vibrio parahaemolyticus]